MSRGKPQVDITEPSPGHFQVIVSVEGMSLTMHVNQQDMLDLHASFNKALFKMGVRYVEETPAEIRRQRQLETEKPCW